MDNVSFTIEEENLICIYHKHDHRRTIAAISDALPDMDADMRPADDGCCVPHFLLLCIINVGTYSRILVPVN